MGCGECEGRCGGVEERPLSFGLGWLGGEEIDMLCYVMLVVEHNFYFLCPKAG